MRKTQKKPTKSKAAPQRERRYLFVDGVSDDLRELLRDEANTVSAGGVSGFIRSILVGLTPTARRTAYFEGRRTEIAAVEQRSKAS